MRPARYAEWISHIFDHPVTDPAWHWDLEAPTFEAEATDIVRLIAVTFKYAGTDLAPFSDEQLSLGLWHLCSMSGSDYSYALKNEQVPLSDRLAAIAAIEELYSGLFARRCSPVLSHLDERPASPLNSICYMFWDTTPLSCLAGYPGEETLADACFSVLGKTLAIDHPACKEAALHGYGEFHCRYPDRVEGAVDAFLRSDILDPRLRTYAANARDGNIQ
jgi:hypothetical protein